MLGALACAAFVVLAMVLEVVGGMSANSEVPDWAPRLVPIAWPRLVRVGWWLAVGVAAGAYRVLLARAGLPQSRWLLVVSVAPFVLFAVGIAAGAEWATWH
ncbi:MAG: hypothetical protein Q8K72_02530 [Acidimicrobiales bacterium]|nr:hypothetical protein [Acidimicrobiales bacterium]